nr:vacuolar protein sorting-associated protein 52 A-like isoform X2 [Ipomoea batatas]
MHLSQHELLIFPTNSLIIALCFSSLRNCSISTDFRAEASMAESRRGEVHGAEIEALNLSASSLSCVPAHFVADVHQKLNLIKESEFVPTVLSFTACGEFTGIYLPATSEGNSHKRNAITGQQDDKEKENEHNRILGIWLEKIGTISIHEEYMKTFEILSKNLKFAEGVPMVKSSKALKDVQPELEKLRQKSISKTEERKPPRSSATTPLPLNQSASSRREEEREGRHYCRRKISARTSSAVHATAEVERRHCGLSFIASRCTRRWRTLLRNTTIVLYCSPPTHSGEKFVTAGAHHCWGLSLLAVCRERET